jgi:hypothetical protein
VCDIFKWTENTVNWYPLDCFNQARNAINEGGNDHLWHSSILVAANYKSQLAVEPNGLLLVRATMTQAEHARVSDGADSFLIEDGWIVAQTIHYTVDER